MATPSYCHEPDDHGLTCLRSNLILVRTLQDKKTEQHEDREIVYRCRVCQGLYKYVYSASYQTRSFDSDEGWLELCDHYFKIEERWAAETPLTIEEARHYGYGGADFTRSGGRCSYPAAPSGLTCRPEALEFVAWCSDDVYDGRIERCRRCGQLYKQVWQQKARFRYFRPGEPNGPEVPFPLEEARRFGHGD